MSIAASIIASTLNAGTPLLIAAAGIVIHEYQFEQWDNIPILWNITF